ncbi:hypothetical protein [Kushneria sp. TE3]|uniref:hypothetical protein n=1 Tax=Kushneria sp. TE3 TaxID=3449832 RepID=UPI003F687854
MIILLRCCTTVAALMPERPGDVREYRAFFFNVDMSRESNSAWFSLRVIKAAVNVACLRYSISGRCDRK